MLERAGINRADLTIAVTGDDEDNLLICQIAKEKYLCSRIIARVNNPRNRPYFELLGIQPAVSATDLILRLIEHEVPSYGLVHLLDLRDEQLEIIEVEVGQGAPAAGRKVGRRRAARRLADHLGAAQRRGLRAQGRHRHRGRRRGPARPRPRPRGAHHGPVPIRRRGLTDRAARCFAGWLLTFRARLRPAKSSVWLWQLGHSSSQVLRAVVVA